MGDTTVWPWKNFTDAAGSGSAGGSVSAGTAAPLEGTGTLRTGSPDGFFIYLVCVLGVTLLPVLANLPKLAGNHYALMELEPFRDLRNGYGNAARQLSLNVVMTVPFGFLWPLVRRKRGLCRAVLAALLLSLCIELLQPLLTTNRTSDITDVIANTAGGLVGYLLFLPFGSHLLHLCGAEDRPRNVDEMPASADNAKNGEGEDQDKF